MYAIIGASGHVGRQVAERLIDEGMEVRAIARHPERLRDLQQMGADLACGDICDTSFMTKALQNVSGVFCMLPTPYDEENPMEFQDQACHAIAKAIKANKIETAVSLSSLGAELTEGTGFIVGLNHLENALNEIDFLNVTHLRCGFFMENMVSMLHMVQTQNIISSPLNPNKPIPVVSTHDVAKAATEWLISSEIIGKNIEELHGPEDLSMKQMTTIMAEEIDRPELRYVQSNRENAIRGLEQMEIPSKAAVKMVELYQFLNSDRYTHEVGRGTEEADLGLTFREFTRDIIVPTWRNMNQRAA